MNKKEQLILAAIELFGRYGVQAVGIDRVIKHAKVARMTLYHHFSSKDELLLCCLRRVDEEMIYQISDYLKKTARPFDINEQGRDFFHYYLTTLRKMKLRGCFFNRVASETSPDLPEHQDLWDLIHSHKKRMHRLIFQKLKEIEVLDISAIELKSDKILLILDALSAREYYMNKDDHALISVIVGDMI